MAVIAALAFPLGDIAAAAAGTFVSYTYNGLGGTRPYSVYTPANYTTSQQVPLIVMLHGCGGSPNDFANTTQMNVLADTNQFIVVYPYETSTYGGCWKWPDPAHQSRGSGEPAIIAGITQTVIADTTHWNVDQSRVYVAGFSAGAGMSVVMAATYPDLYAAMGEAAGVEYKALSNGAIAPTLPSGGPDPVLQGQAAYNAMGQYARVMPVIAFQGSQDTTVPPVNGDQVVKQWMETDRLASGGTYNASFSAPSGTVTGRAPVTNGQAYTVRSWNDPSSNEVEEYWTVTGMGHAWSGGSTTGQYADPLGPSASQNMYAFFMAHVLGPPPPPQPLQVTSVAVGNLVATSAVITWQTNNTANSRVDFGTSITYDSFASDPALVTNHSITLTGLTANTTYHYQVTSVDGHAQTATSIDATFGTTAANFSLQLSAAADRSASSALQGQTVAGTIYVFTSPASGVTRVRFWLDNPQMSGTPRQTEGAAPWDFAGTAANGTANPTNTTTIPNGSHTITAAVDKSAGGTDVLSSSFTISNAGPPPPPPSGFSLQVSAAADRSASSALQGRTVAGTIYVFVSPASGVTRVRFWLDNPQMSGTPRQTEGAAPWDFAGTATNGTANPTNTTTIANGSHTITAAVDKSAGGTDVLSSTFTVGN